MIGLVLKVMEPRTRKSGGNVYQWVFFRDMRTGDCVPMCLPHIDNILRNWTDALTRGNVLEDLNVILRGQQKFVDAKSHPHLVCKLDEKEIHKA